MRLFGHGLIAGILLIVAASAVFKTVNVDEFLATDVAGTAFSDHLAREYQWLTRIEAKEGLFDTHAARLASKGLKALKGNVVKPWNPAQWDLDLADQMTLQAGHNRLMAALIKGMELEPAACAMAQVSFDGWVEQVFDNRWDTLRETPAPSDEDAAKALFLDSVRHCEGAPQEVKAEVKRGEFVIYFAWDHVNLTPKAYEVVEQAVAFAQELGDAKVSVVGYDDTSATAERAELLSASRASNVADALRAQGLEFDVIDWRGESDPAIKTEDGVREPMNRRVEILIAKK